MINEPNVHQDLYTDAVAIVAAETLERALELLAAQENGWMIEEIERLAPREFNCDHEGIVFEDVRGS
jgi:hypothetical protein